MTAHDHAHPHGHVHGHSHGHTHGLVDESIKRSRAGLRAVTLALLVLGLTAAAQVAVFIASGSVALLADLIHNAGDAATAIPLGHRVRPCAAHAPSAGPGWQSSSPSS